MLDPKIWCGCKVEKWIVTISVHANYESREKNKTITHILYCIITKTDYSLKIENYLAMLLVHIPCVIPACPSPVPSTIIIKFLVNW